MGAVGPKRKSKRSGPSARARPNPELALEFAKLLGKPHAHQLGVCGKLRIPYSTYKRWMATEPGEKDSELAEFQGIVLEALEAARVREIERLERDFKGLRGAEVAKAGALVNMRTFHHTNRFKRFYAQDDEPKKLEMSGPDGKPFKTEQSGKIEHGFTAAAAREMKLRFLGVSEERLARGAKAKATSGDGG